MKYIDAAMVRLKNKKAMDESDLSLVERILAKETDPKLAYIFALDLILVGIDTASNAMLQIIITLIIHYYYSNYNYIKIIIIMMMAELL